MTSPDPIPLLDSPEFAAALRADLAHAGNVAVTGLDKGAGLAALKTAIAAEGATLATTAVTSSSMLGKLVVGALIVAGIGVAMWAATGPDASPPAAVEPVVATPVVVADVEVPPPPAPEPAAIVAAPARADVRTHAAEPEPLPEAEPVELQEPSKPKTRTPAKRKKLEAAPSDERLESAVLREARMVREARGLLGVNPSRSLAITRDAAGEFPRGQLVEEREAIAIRALAKLGRRDAAQSRADLFLAKYGSGPYAEAVRRAIAP